MVRSIAWIWRGGDGEVFDVFWSWLCLRGAVVGGGEKWSCGEKFVDVEKGVWCELKAGRCR